MSWPAHTMETRPWRQIQRAGTRADRVLSTVTVSIPPKIAKLSLDIGASVLAEMEAALAEIVALEQAHGQTLSALGVLLLCTESVASSKIEYVEASLDDYARALHGSRANSSATSMVAATDALETLLAQTDRDHVITDQSVLAAQALLMADDPNESRYAGRWRDMQNWIGGSDYSPRNALYVPPPPELVAASMTDLLTFANRDDLPVLAQAAVAHAQFESIHPFTDGNGRIGRALINAILRRRGITSTVVVPLASALVADREGYFRLLETYRAGLIDPLVLAFAAASRIAAAESRVTATRLAEIPARWVEQLGRVRTGSATANLLGLLLARPVLSANEISAAIGGPLSSTYVAIDRLHAAGVLRPLTDRKRDQIWGASLVLDELDDLSDRIADAARP